MFPVKPTAKRTTTLEFFAICSKQWIYCFHITVHLCALAEVWIPMMLCFVTEDWSLEDTWGNQRGGFTQLTNGELLTFKRKRGLSLCFISRCWVSVRTDYTQQFKTCLLPFASRNVKYKKKKKSHHWRDTAKSTASSSCKYSCALDAYSEGTYYFFLPQKLCGCNWVYNALSTSYVLHRYYWLVLA